MMTKTEIEDAVSLVRRLARVVLEPIGKKDRFMERLAKFTEVTLPDAWVEDLIDRAEDGNRHAEAVLCTLAAARFARKDTSPLDVWLCCRLEDRARKYEHMRGRSSDTNLNRNLFIVWVIKMLCRE